MNSFMNYDFNIEKIILACHVPAGTGKHIHRNRPSHGLALHISGIKEYVFDNGEKLAVHPNDIIYMPKSSNYDVHSQIQGECYAINFDIPQVVGFAPFVIKAINFSFISERFKTAKKIWEMKKPGYMTKCKAELYNVLYAMQQEYFSGYAPKTKLKVIEPAVDYIHNKYVQENISIDKLSKMCGITPEYFRSIFKKYYGVSPLIYINNLKITRAKELIESGLYSISEAAIQSGYIDMSHFSREFKKATGDCPSQYMPKKNVQLF